MKRDPHNYERKYNNWKGKTKDGIPSISKANSDIIKKFLNDMEVGRNVSVHSKKGSRSFIRLNTIRDKLIFFSRKFEALYGLKCIVDISEEHIHTFFADMRSGKIKKVDGKDYIALEDQLIPFEKVVRFINIMHSNLTIMMSYTAYSDKYNRDQLTDKLVNKMVGLFFELESQSQIRI